jgi:hypothetical protein
MNAKLHVAIIMIILSSTSLILVEHVTASDGNLNLPVTPITIEVYNGTGDYFDTLVRNIPLGFDVVNGSYPGWCVDLRYVMARSPAVHQAILFSSLSPPLDLTHEKWDMVNYVLNHKQGKEEDVQQAVWYFVNLMGNYSVSSTKALAMIDAARANGTGFVPGIDQVIAVICYPYSVFQPAPNVQISVIEVRTPGSLAGDLNGDGVVNIIDINIVARAFRSKLGDPNWNSIADVNHDGVVDIIDINIVAKDWGKTASP